MKQTSRRISGALFVVMLASMALTSVAAADQGTPDTAPDTAQPQIVGGNPADPGEYPYMAALIDAGTADPFYGQFCGGSVVAPTYILTAAHCVAGETANSIDVLVGTNLLSTGGTRIDVSAITTHPSYNANTSAWDFAVIQLATPTSQTPVDFGLPGGEAFWAPGTDATVTGWGNLTGSGSNFPDALQEVAVPIVSDAQCASAYGGNVIKGDSMICAGLLGTGGKDSCQGDSGGPMVVPGPNGWLQVGVVSWGYGCAEAQYPGVYSEVPAAATWIDGIIGTSPGGDAPDITSANPTSGPTTGGTKVTLQGSHFSGATSVTVGGNAALFQVKNDGLMVLKTPAGGAGPTTIVVTTPDGSDSTPFTYGSDGGGSSAPTVNSVSPASGPASGGAKVRLQGSHFTGATSVTVGGTPAQFKVKNDTTLVLKTPAGSPGATSIVVTTGAGPGSGAYTYL